MQRELAAWHAGAREHWAQPLLQALHGFASACRAGQAQQHLAGPDSLALALLVARATAQPDGSCQLLRRLELPAPPAVTPLPNAQALIACQEVVPHASGGTRRPPASRRPPAAAAPRRRPAAAPPTRLLHALLGAPACLPEPARPARPTPPPAGVAMAKAKLYVALKSLQLAWQLVRGQAGGCALRGTVWVGSVPAGGAGELVEGSEEQLEGMVLEVRRG
jgi:hypothetical protein